MKKEEWINKVIESTTEIREVDANPFLYQKLTNKINHQETKQKTILKYNINWAIAFTIVVIINISALFIYNSNVKREKEAIAITALSNEMDVYNTVNF